MNITGDIIKSKALSSLSMRNIREISIGNVVNVCLNHELVYAVAVVDLELWKTHTLGEVNLLSRNYFLELRSTQ